MRGVRDAGDEGAAVVLRKLGSVLAAAVVVLRTCRAGRCGAAISWGEDQFLRGAGGSGLAQQHVASGAIEQGGEDGGWVGGAIVAEDALVGDAAGNFHAGEFGDLAKDLIQAGVVGADVEQAGSVGDFSVMGLLGGGRGDDRGVLRGGRGQRGGRRRRKGLRGHDGARGESKGGADEQAKIHGSLSGTCGAGSSVART